MGALNRTNFRGQTYCVFLSCWISVAAIRHVCGRGHRTRLFESLLRRRYIYRLATLQFGGFASAVSEHVRFAPSALGVTRLITCALPSKWMDLLALHINSTPPSSSFCQNHSHPEHHGSESPPSEPSTTCSSFARRISPRTRRHHRFRVRRYSPRCRPRFTSPQRRL